jgi:hypothetical protein
MTEARPWVLETQQRGRMGYMHVSVNSLCNPSAFRDAGIADPYGARRSVRVEPAFQKLTAHVLRRSTTNMVSPQISTNKRIPAS